LNNLLQTFSYFLILFFFSASSKETVCDSPEEKRCSPFVFFFSFLFLFLENLLFVISERKERKARIAFFFLSTY